MKINCYMNFDGNCAEALMFYGRVFEVSPTIMTFGDMPENPDFPLNEEMKKLVAHGRLDIEGNELMFSDVVPGMSFIRGNNISVSVTINDKEKVTEWFEGLSEGGLIEMPLEQTMWSPLYGSLIDQFGIGWQVNYGE